MFLKNLWTARGLKTYFQVLLWYVHVFMCFVVCVFSSMVTFKIIIYPYMSKIFFSQL